MRGHPAGKLHPSRTKSQVGEKERTEREKGQEKGDETGEVQKAAMRTSLQQPNPSLPLGADT